MASLIPGYEYDIFISYRQKDNKGDRWVSEFVDALKTELESTFKEDISVYFDINPHDGLLETHDVSDSLKEKLKCLIFIPIISRTYCDNKSFAWEHEFKAFVEIASKDKFGLKVKLPNGNVANRVLPVRIHDLDTFDLKLCESLIGGVLRGVDFIYKEPGVNRPLMANEDHPDNNLNKTFYRNQINKVALAINDIINGLKFVQTVDDERAENKIDIPTDVNLLHKKTSVTESSDTKNIKSDVSRPGKSNKTSRRITSFGSLAIILAVIALILFSSGSSLPFSKRDWIVITDFENLTDNPVFDKSLYTAFSLTVNQSSYVNIFPKARMIEALTRMELKDRAHIDEKTGREIAIREGCKIIIVPSISEVGSKYVITAKIMETKTGNLLRSEILYAQRQDEILATLDHLSRKIRRHLGESIYDIAIQDKPLSKVTTSSLEALKQYSLGIEHHLLLDFGGAKNYYTNALRIDTGFTAARASLGNLFIEKLDSVKKGRELLNLAVKSADKLTDRERLGILAFYAASVENDVPKAIRYSKMLIDLYPDDPIAHNNLGWYYQKLSQFEEALEEYKAAVRINRKLALTYSGIVWIYLEKLGKADSALVWAGKMIYDNSQVTWGYCGLGAAWLSLDSLNKAEVAFGKARELNPEFIINLYRLAHTYRLKGNYFKAIGILKRILEINPSELSALYDLGVNYQSMNNQEEASKWFSKFKQTVTEEWIKKWPDDAGTYIALSAVMARLGKLDSSALILQKAIKIDSTLHVQFAEVLCIQGKTIEALGELEKAMNNGYRNLFWLKMTPDLGLLKYDIRFQDILRKYFK